MTQTGITLMICVAAEALLVSSCVSERRRCRRENRRPGLYARLGVWLGIPFLLFTVIACAMNLS